MVNSQEKNTKTEVGFESCSVLTLHEYTLYVGKHVDKLVSKTSAVGLKKKQHITAGEGAFFRSRGTKYQVWIMHFGHRNFAAFPKSYDG